MSLAMAPTRDTVGAPNRGHICHCHCVTVSQCHCVPVSLCHQELVEHIWDPGTPPAHLLRPKISSPLLRRPFTGLGRGGQARILEGEREGAGDKWESLG